MDDIKLNVLRGVDVEAKYVRSPLRQYQGNPLIEALPPISSLENSINKLSNVLTFRESDRNKNATLRAHCVFQLTRFVEPIEVHIQIEQALSIIIRDGYVDRNPLSVNGVRILREGAENAKKEMNSQNVKIDYNYKTSGSGLTIVGVSGMGKTTAINNILLKMYPAQIIRHGSYKGKNLNRPQIVWMKLETPPSGSIKGLCLNFFQLLDELLGTNYFLTYKKRLFTTEQLIPEIAQLCATYSVGVLVIDEIQHLHDLNVGGQNQMLNFFVALKNAIGIPIVLIGTLKAWNLLTREFRQTRRAVDYFGMIRWDRMKYSKDKDDKDYPGEWECFLKALWNYQWTKQVAELDDTMISTMYEFSQGITDIAVKLFMVAQWRAISNRDELISPELISNVAKSELKAVFPIIQAFRVGNEAVLETELDVFQKDFEVENHFASVLAELAKRLKYNEKNQNVPQQINDRSCVRETIEWLVEAGTSATIAEEIVNKVKSAHKEVLLPELKLLSFQLLLDTKNKIEKKIRKKPSTKQSRSKGETPKIMPTEVMADVKSADEL